jgi:RNA polymerase sigma factor (sigma-70 family)
MASTDPGGHAGNSVVSDDSLAELTTGLRRAFTAALGPDLAADALGEALAYLVENEDRIRAMDNPGGYLYTVGRRRALRFARPRRSNKAFPEPRSVGMPEVEPELVAAMSRLTERQRVCVVLVHGFGYSHREVAELLDISTETSQTHCRRALKRLRKQLGEIE